LDRKNSTKLNLIDYWKIHSQKISIKFEEKSLRLKGEPGFYYPQKSNYYTQPSTVERKISNLKMSSAFEIRPVTGNMVSLFFHHFSNKVFLIEYSKNIHSLSWRNLAHTPRSHSPMR
jgi:hypothetical protein